MLPRQLLRDHRRPGEVTATKGRAGFAPQNVILFIADGFGPASAGLARDYLRWYAPNRGLALDPMQVGSVRTRAVDSAITDSAAAATAYATGRKTTNGSVAVAPDGTRLRTILEGAQRTGMAAGLVATSRITHATPAAFSAHVDDRAQEDEIARQQLEQDLDVILGGGRRHFLPASIPTGVRTDDRHLLDEARGDGVAVVGTARALADLEHGPALGLFADNHMAYQIDRHGTTEPSLPAMTRAAIRLLSGHQNGFFLMVEGSRIDHAAHQNDPAAHVREVLAFDNAVSAALDATQGSDTLVLCVADHETGGLTLGRTTDGTPTADWSPGVLGHAQASCAHMYNQLLQEGPASGDGALAAGDCQAVLSDVAGLSDVTDRDVEAILADPRPGVLGERVSHRAQVGWTTTGHTATDVQLYARGPGAVRFVGNHDNAEIGQKLGELMGVELRPASTGVFRSAP